MSRRGLAWGLALGTLAAAGAMGLSVAILADLGEPDLHPVASVTRDTPRAIREFAKVEDLGASVTRDTATPAPSATPTPTATPTPESVLAPPTYAPAPVLAAGIEQWHELVASVFEPWAVEDVLAVMACESGGDPNATGSAGERGLMQIHPIHVDSTYEPLGNLRAAWRISNGGRDWTAWAARCRP